MNSLLDSKYILIVITEEGFMVEKLTDLTKDEATVAKSLVMRGETVLRAELYERCK